MSQAIRRTAPAARTLPLVIAHRGASAERAEHTLGAYQRAIEQGADGLECDVRLTSDGHVVCVHDRTIDRTSTGSGVVSSQTLAELSRHDFGSWAEGDDSPDEEPDYDEERQTVLTLNRLLELAVSVDRSLHLAIETKHPTRYGGYLEKRVLELLQRFGLDRRAANRPSVAVMSFSEVAMRRVRVLAPEMATVFLMDKVPLRFRNGALPYRAPIAGPGIHIIRRHPGYVKRLHDAGKKVYVWTVDDPADVGLCLGLGVDAIISNRPAEVLAQVDRARRDRQAQR